MADAKVYSEADLEDIKSTYLKTPNRETVEALAAKYSTNVRSIVSRLSRAGIYKRPEYRTKTGELPHTKDDIVGVIADLMGDPPDELEGLEKAPKLVLRKIALALDPSAMDKFKG